MNGAVTRGVDSGPYQMKTFRLISCYWHDRGYSAKTTPREIKGLELKRSEYYKVIS